MKDLIHNCFKHIRALNNKIKKKYEKSWLSTEHQVIYYDKRSTFAMLLKQNEFVLQR